MIASPRREQRSKTPQKLPDVLVAIEQVDADKHVLEGVGRILEIEPETPGPFEHADWRRIATGFESSVDLPWLPTCGRPLTPVACIIECMADIAAPRTTGSASLIRIGGAAGLAGGLAWVVKGVVILAVDEQPPLTFEVAMPLFGFCLLGVAHLTLPTSRRRTVIVALAWLAVVSGLVALMSELIGGSWDPSITVSALALLMGQVCLARITPAPAPLTFWVGVATLPALLVGGMLAEADERLLEIPLVCLGLAWMLVGWMTLRR